MSRFEEISETLSGLVKQFSAILSSEERRQLEEFIEYGEGGVALQVLIDLLLVHRGAIPQKTFLVMRQVAEKMEMSSEVDWDRLKAKIGEE